MDAPLSSADVKFLLNQRREATFVIVSASEPQSQYIAKQNGSTKETVSPKIGENIEMLVCFICTRHKTGLLLISIIVIELQ